MPGAESSRKQQEALLLRHELNQLLGLAKRDDLVEGALAGSHGDPLKSRPRTGLREPVSRQVLKVTGSSRHDERRLHQL
ncbi:MAG: hypothetical protein NT037_12280 [Hyphomicrobiales bacterium]|nr:hypothetical protein [Hyphomicrobiales bacterium]